MTSAKRSLITCLMCVLGLPALADEWFIEGDLGASHAPLAHVEYDDPVGSIFAVNRTEGTGIVPQRVTRSAWSLGAALSAARLFDDCYFLRATYRYFGETSADADGIFFFAPIGPRQISSPSFPQTMSASGHGVFLGAGAALRLWPDWFVEPSAEVGAALVQSSGVRDVGTIIQQPFPRRTRFNLAYGAGLTVGRRLGSNVALAAVMNWDHLGRAETGFAPDIGGGPRFAPSVRPTASMTARFSAASLMLGVRYGF